jgi:hypothetical protein
MFELFRVEYKLELIKSSDMDDCMTTDQAVSCPGRLYLSRKACVDVSTKKYIGAMSPYNKEKPCGIVFLSRDFMLFGPYEEASTLISNEASV